MSDPDFDLAAHPNDAYFKAVFSQPEQAAAFFEEHLPPALSKGVNWKTLKLLPGSFVKRSLQQAHADLLFSAMAGDRQVLMYLLFEHQTTPDAVMPLRLLAYMLEIWQAHEREYGLPLPVIVPFVLHQGPDKWTVTRRFEDLLDIPQELAAEILPLVPKFEHALLDLTQFDPAVQEDHAQLRAIFQLMKLARAKKLVEFFRWLAAQTLQPLSPELLRSTLMYALHTDVHLDVETICRTLEGNPALREQTMSIAQTLIEKGKAEGEARGRLRLLQELMGIPPIPAEELDRMSVEEMQARFESLQEEYGRRFKRP